MYAVQKWLLYWGTNHMQRNYHPPSLPAQIKIWLLKTEGYNIHRYDNKRNAQNMEHEDLRIPLIFEAHVLFMAVFLPARKLLRVSIANFEQNPRITNAHTCVAFSGTSALYKNKIYITQCTNFLLPDHMVPSHTMLPTRNICKLKFETLTWIFEDYIRPFETRLHCITTNSNYPLRYSLS
jgi:hypothetical protein